jgi:hypothetical protein
MSADLRDLLHEAAPTLPGSLPDATLAWRRGLRLRARRRAAYLAGVAASLVGVLVVGVLLTRPPLVSPMPVIADGPDRAEGWYEVGVSPLEPRDRHGAVWTGDKVIVWGGSGPDFDYLDDGAAWTPGTNSWEALPAAPLEGRAGPTLVWTGSEVLVTGGMITTNRRMERGGEVIEARPITPGMTAFDTGEVHFTDGAAYDPEARTWRSIAAFPLEGRARAATAWTGSELLVWGGVTSLYSGPRTVLGDGAAYDPVADRWRELPPAPLSPRAGASAVWTGDRLIVWGGVAELGSDDTAPPTMRHLRDGAIYDPAADSWTAMAPGPSTGPGPGFDVQDAVWTGTHMLVWFGRELAAYDPITDAWRDLPSWPEEGIQHAPEAIWLDGGLAVWSGWIHDGTHNEGPRSVGYVYDPATIVWYAMSPAPLSPRSGHTLTWTHHGLFIWGGRPGGSPAYANDGAVYWPG